MHLLVTTSKSFLLLDTESGVWFPLDRGHGLYYGICSNAEHLFVAARNRSVSSDMPPSEERGEILIFDRTLQMCGSLQAPFPLRDLHEIAWQDGRLWATCSQDNMIAIHEGGKWEQWFPLGGTLDGPGDVNHFNSFMFERDRVWILAHNRGDSELLAFSTATRDLIERVALGHCAHNIWRENDQLFTCSSLEGKLMGNRGFLVETSGFPRGVAFCENRRYVGISAMAERKDRDFTTGKLVIFDRDWVRHKEIVLSDEGLILDIQLLPDGFRHVQADAANAPILKSSQGSSMQISANPDANTMSDLFYRSYEERNRGSRALIKSRLAAYQSFIAPLVMHERVAKAIDLGCGRGEWLETLGDAGFDAAGVDLDDGMLAACREQGLNARRADALTTLRELPAESMAVVSAFHVVEHLPFDEVRLLVSEALRVLQPGGLLILETPNPENLVVGATLFYQDPSHVRPIPPELLNFVTEFEGFHRKIVARLNEAPQLRSGADIELIDVLGGVSPDYAIVAQKNADAELLREFDRAFDGDYGVTLASLAHRYQIKQQSRAENLISAHLAQMEHRVAAQIARVEHGAAAQISNAETRLADQAGRLSAMENRVADFGQRTEQLEIRLAQAELHAAQLLLMQNSRSWRLTAPLRWLGVQARLLRRDGLTARMRAMVGKFAKSFAPAPAVVNEPSPPQMPQQAQLPPSEIADTEVNPPAITAPAEVALSELPARARKIYRDIKTANERNRETP
jgi:SAM-dependent methyltransferase